MRKGNPILRGIVVVARRPRIRTFFTRTPLLSVTVRSDEWTITAQTPDEKTLGIASDGPTRGAHTVLLGPPIHVLSRIDMTIGAVSPGATGTMLRLVRKAACTRAVSSHEAT